MGLKSIESILRSGLSNAQKGMLDWTTGGAQHRQDQYVERISRIIKCKILGTVVAPAQWRFPLSEDGTMGTLSMDNNRRRSIMNSIELLVEESFPNSPDVNRLRLLRCFPKYRARLDIRKQIHNDAPLWMARIRVSVRTPTRKNQQQNTCLSNTTASSG